MKYETKDSGNREQFDSGAVRDTREGKGRFDLISPFALRRLAGLMERGAVKYGDWNWAKGMPKERFLDSAMRHLNTYWINELSGKPQDEDHLAAVAFNVFALIHFEEHETQD